MAAVILENNIAHDTYTRIAGYQLLKFGSKFQKLITSNPGIGVMSNIIFQYNRCQIDETFRLYVFSDGVFEITQKNGKVWELEEFVGFLTSLSPTDASILDRLIEHAKAMNRTEFFEDDYTMIEIEFT